VITAHHQDDLVETALINLIRGTSWRGLASLEFSSSAFGLNIIRPLLNISKKEILRYAEAHELQWVEDSSNQNLEYLRNYVRRTLIPSAQVKDPLFTEKLTALITNTQSLKATINQELQTIVAQCTLQQDPSSNELPRYSLIMWPDEVSREVIYLLLTQLDPTWHPSKLQIIRALHFIKSGLPGKEIQISGKLTIVLKTRTVQFKTV
ncbi:MAG: tRNA(Ile)-lysidine synthase, partial [Patescibacteria group bacterium]|nr:tRNA(Ile)-lysidine synthase [Patescibacteria group bacterium]